MRFKSIKNTDSIDNSSIKVNRNTKKYYQKII